MTSDGTDLLRTVSRWTMERMRRLGATVTDTSIEATEEQLWKGMSPSHRRQLELKGNLTVTGGSSVPDWVPENAKIYIDLVNDRAWTDTDGEVAINNTLLGTDANTVNGWSATGYSAGDLTADGLVYSTHPPAMIGMALTKVLAGATARYQFKCLDIFSAADFVLVAADGSDGMDVSLSEHSEQGRFVIETWTGTIANHDNAVNYGVGAINAVAITITPARFEAAVNGSVAYTNSDMHPNVVAALIETNGIHTALQSITIYDPLPSTAGLSALSETGVTNTAPHTLTWVNHLNGGDDAFEIDTGWPLTTGRQIIDTIAAVDDQGNPLTIALSDDGAGQFILEDGNVNVTSDINDPAGPFNFTLRATDPGGLYVEQQFTITVTA